MGNKATFPRRRRSAYTLCGALSNWHIDDADDIMYSGIQKLRRNATHEQFQGRRQVRQGGLDMSTPVYPSVTPLGSLSVACRDDM